MFILQVNQDESLFYLNEAAKGWGEMTVQCCPCRILIRVIN